MHKLYKVILILIMLGIAAASAIAVEKTAFVVQDTPGTLPRLVDLGAGRCIPCRKMEPILDQLRKDYSEQFEVVFIDVWKNQDAGEFYRPQVIPTQIFFDRDGNELFRHGGFYSRNQILDKWHDLGFDFDTSPE